MLGIEFAALDRFQAEGDFFAITQHESLHFLANGQAGDQPHEIGHLFVVTRLGGRISQTQQQVARLQARSGGGRIVDDAADQNSALVFGMFKQWLSVDAQPASPDFAVGNEFFGDTAGEVARDGAA